MQIFRKAGEGTEKTWKIGRPQISEGEEEEEQT